MIFNLDHFCLVFDHTTHPGNLGSIARVAKTMGISDVRLIAPECDKSDERAITLAVSAADLLEKFQEFSTAEDALADCSLVFATSARFRAIQPITVSPAEIVGKSFHELKQHGLTEDNSDLKIAILFGTEHSGLPNELLMKANYHIVIDTNPEYSSLNLAMATQVICYELRHQLARLAEEIAGFNPAKLPDRSHKLADFKNIEHYLNRVENYYNKTGFILHDMVIPRLNRLVRRAQLEQKELDLLQGFLTSNIKYTEKLEQKVAELEQEKIKTK